MVQNSAIYPEQKGDSEARDGEFASYARLPLDERFYASEVSDENIAFLKVQTGFKGDDEIKKHVMKIQADAYQVYPYPFIRWFWFVETSISQNPAYERLQNLGKTKPGAIFLEVPSAFGNDVRKVVADGFQPQNCIAADLEASYWELGHRLFKSSPETFPVTFIPGDIFDPTYLALSPPLSALPSTPAPALPGLSSLTPLQGYVSAIHASMFFHLFDEAKQLELARRLASLLSPAPGSLILGRQVAAPIKGPRDAVSRAPDQPVARLFCHTPASWAALWDGMVFKEGTVRVEAELREVTLYADSPPEQRVWWMLWSVTRL